MAWQVIQKFIRLESFSGFLLCALAILGLILANSPFANIYKESLQGQLAWIYNGHTIKTSIEFIINDGLMVLFFLLVGLEIKREVLVGELNSWRKISLPGIAAVGGMLLPAILYLMITRHHSELWRGWAIPTATDIAFALGILNLLGNRIPFSLKVFLTALAIFDDLGAILVIAFFYTATLHWQYLGYAALALLSLAILNWRGVCQAWVYILGGIILWWCVLNSGVHPTIAGVLLAFCIPLKAKPVNSHQSSLLQTFEQQLHPWVAFFILPLFAFANTGIALHEFSLFHLFHPLTLGILLALFLGKQLGVFGAILIAIKSKFSPMPTGSNWVSLYGVSLLCGIGFTMSLFIGALAFSDQNLLTLARLGILLGSLLSGIIGYILLRFAMRTTLL